MVNCRIDEKATWLPLPTSFVVAVFPLFIESYRKKLRQRISNRPYSRQILYLINHNIII